MEGTKLKKANQQRIKKKNARKVVVGIMRFAAPQCE
jgi:hypothetical protein